MFVWKVTVDCFAVMIQKKMEIRQKLLWRLKLCQIEANVEDGNVIVYHYFLFGPHHFMSNLVYQAERLTRKQINIL